MSDTQTVAPSLTIERYYNVPPERVYAAWTDPKRASQFMGPHDVRAENIEMDVRPGGSFQIVMVKPDGERLRAYGVYREVSPPNRVSMTWRWEEDDPKDEHESVLTLQTRARRNGVRVTARAPRIRGIARPSQRRLVGDRR
jgi:uncharacterized protein YndB with AHSA1/START domain